ncbi:GtrA family protein [Albibacterium sp.]|uniref:GtrA family protein n=1 Tax=Albibacterium sp. TaxID=2952885 RepID=UPI002D18B214|nr:GtrA family protein [Albibacterium sp.]HUH18460.1 GtrA family protein [Albibacterium sp.]
MNKKSSFLVFIKAQASAFIGGLVDYSIMIVCTELAHIHYTVSILISGLIGAVVNFMINRYWTYQADKIEVKGQLLKFIAVVIGSILLKSSGTYLFTNWLKVDYKISRVITDILVSLGFNYTLQTYWVFRKGEALK